VADKLPGPLWGTEVSGWWGVRHGSGLILLPVLILIAGCGNRESERDPTLRDATAGSGPGSEDLPLRIVDATGRMVVLDSLPRRIVSLVPSASEILLSLDASDVLVARTDHDTVSALARLPSVGGGLHPNPEAVIALKPDLVILFAGDSDLATPQLLDRMGIQHLAIRPDRIRDVREIIRQMGTVSGRRARADTLLARIDSALGAIRQRVHDRPRIRVCYLLGGTPPWVAGPGSFIGELLEVAGGENVFSDLDMRYGPVNPEVFLVREMDLLLAARGATIALPQTDIPLRRVSPTVEIPGPNLAAAAFELARTIHPEAFR
jgi:iron complex transport system substrate-binding protein